MFYILMICTYETFFFNIKIIREIIMKLVSRRYVTFNFSET